MSLWSSFKKFIGIEKPQSPPPPEFPTEPPPPPVIPPEPPQPPEDNGRRGRDYWEERVIGKKEEIWGDTGRYNPQRASRYVHSGVTPDEKPSLSLLQWAANASDEELEVAIREGGQYSFLFYK